MKRFKRNTVFFVSGGAGYALIEILWRGRTHWSMVIAGGLCFILFSLIAEKFVERPLIYKALLCAVGVTAVELVFGIVFNMIFEMNVWDYSKVPFNFLGQICLYYTLVWGAFGFLFVPLADKINQKMKV